MFRRLVIGVIIIVLLAFSLAVTHVSRAACTGIANSFAGVGDINNTDTINTDCPAITGNTNALTGVGNINNGLTVNGNVNGSIFGNGNTFDGVGNINNGLTVNGNVNGSVFGNANTFDEVGNINNSTTVNGNVAGSVFGNANTLDGVGNINNSTTVNGNVNGSVFGNASTLSGVGNINNTLTINGNVNGPIFGNANSLSGVGNINNTLILKGGRVTGRINGDSSDLRGVGTTTNTLIFNQTITSEAEWDRLKALLPTLLPSSGSVTINGLTYSYNGFDQLFDELILALRVTWFDPGDGRVDPRPGDHLAAYCNLDKGTIGAIIIGTADSQGTTLTTFSYAQIKAAGKNGLSVNLGALGTVSLSVDSQNNFWMAWNGGIYHATGQGDFAKGFTCTFS